MVIGSVLLQPQRLQRASTRDASAALMDDLMRLAFCLAKDAADGAPALLKIEQAVEATAQAMLNAKSAGIQAAVQRFDGLFETVREQVEAFVAESFDDAGDLMHLIAELLDAFVGVAEGLSPGVFRQRVNDVFAVVADDLGITPAFIEETVWALFDGMVLALNQAAGRRKPGAACQPPRDRPAAGAHPAAPARHVHLPTVQRRPGGRRAAHTAGRDSVWRSWRRQAACTGQGLATYFRAGNSLLDLINYSAFPAFGEGSVGAAAAPPAREQYCWYATWLLEYQNSSADLGVLPASIAEELLDGYVAEALRDAFRPLSVVLARWANLQTVTEHESWKVIDRKKYIINRVNSEQLAVYRLFEMSEGDFLDAAAEMSKLQKAFLENGIRLSGSLSVAHEEGSNLWTIVAGVLTYRAFREGGTVTIHPADAGGRAVRCGRGAYPRARSAADVERTGVCVRVGRRPLDAKSARNRSHAGDGVAGGRRRTGIYHQESGEPVRGQHGQRGRLDQSAPGLAGRR